MAKREPKEPFSAARAGEDREGYKDGGGTKWIQKAVPPSHKGRLHRALGVPEGEPIPAAKKRAALHSKNPHVRHMAQFAKNV